MPLMSSSLKGLLVSQIDTRSAAAGRTQYFAASRELTSAPFVKPQQKARNINQLIDLS